MEYWNDGFLEVILQYSNTPICLLAEVHMKRSTERILVTHAGTLPQPKDLKEMLDAKNEGKPYDHEAYSRRVRSAVAEGVRQQVDCGVDIVNDGELGKPNFSRYTRERLSGFVEKPAGPDFRPTSIFGRDMIEFSEYFNRGGRTSIGHHSRVFYCAEPLKYVGHAEVKADIENLKAALQGKAIEEAFLPAIAPGTMEHWMKNEYYPTDEAYLFAIADAMHEEYQAIVDAGFVLQVDDPALTNLYGQDQSLSFAERHKRAELYIEALNYASGASRQSRYASTRAMGSMKAPVSTTHPCKTSSTSSCVSTLGPILLRRRIRATPMNGTCGSTSSSLRTRCSFQA